MTNSTYHRLEDAQPAAVEGTMPSATTSVSSRKRNYVIGATAVVVLGVVGIIVALTSSGNGPKGSSGSPSGTSGGSPSDTDIKQASASQVFGKLVHPIIGRVPVHSVDTGDEETEGFRSSVHVETPDHFTHLTFNVEARKDRINFDQENAVADVKCNGDSLTVTLKTPGAAANMSTRLHAGTTVLTVLKEWGCSKAGIYIVDTHGDITVNGHEITIPVIAGAINDLFKHAVIRFNGTGFPTSSASTAGSSAASSRARRSTDDDNDFFSDAGSDIESFFGGITTAISGAWNGIVGDITTAYDDIDNWKQDAEEAAKFIETLIKNNGDYDHTFTPVHKSVNIGPKALSSQVPFLTGQYGYDFSISFEVDITDYELSKLSLQVNGDANAAIRAEGSVISHSWSGGTPTETVLPKQTLLTFYIPIGPIQLPVSISGSLNGKLTWDVEADVTISGDVTASGTVNAGVQYTKSGGYTQQNPVVNLQGDAELNYIAATAKGTVTVSMNAMLMVEAMYSAGVSTQAGVVPVVHAVVSEAIEGGGVSVTSTDFKDWKMTPVDPSQPGWSDACHPTEGSGHVDTPSVLASVGCGVTVTAAAFIDIPKLQVDKSYNLCQSMPGGDCYNKLWNPIDSWCFHPPL